MARPTQSKEVKPKGQEGGGEAAAGPAAASGNFTQMMIMAVVIIVFTSLTSAASVVFLAPMVIKPLLAQMAPKAPGGDAAGGDASAGGDAAAAPEAPKTPTVGPVLSLDEFTVNLKDPGGQRYLRATVSLTLTADDPKFDALTGEALGKWEEEFHHEMGHYVPTVRDICISAFTKRTASELSTEQGKEEVKQEIKKNVEGLLQGKHKVIRVNFENFIIQ